MAAAATGAAATKVEVLINGALIPDADFISYVVDRDMFQPDMAAVVLSNQGDIYSAQTMAATVEIKIGDDRKSIFKGEITGLEPSYKGAETTRLLVRAMNPMHRLRRLRKSLTFTKMDDQAILSQVVSEAGLQIEWVGTKITHKHVYQHNLSGLEFLRMRAARLGCHVWCVDQKIHVVEPNFSVVSGLKLSVDEGGNLRAFTPRISSASVVKQVTVQGWNPETKQLITGEALAGASALGTKHASDACGDHGRAETFTVDHPIWSQEEAAALAKARLRELNLSFMTGEAEIAGNPDVQMGTVIEIIANATNGNDRFNGKYYVMGVTHRHTMPKGKEGGYVTIVKFARDAENG